MTDQQRPIVHLFCNAHIDPVWRWGWEEGAREAISTFRTAVNLLGEYPEFVFNHNESLLYEWVEEYDPPLFEQIRELVRQGRWNITGGWYLQPDVNLPGGETLARVILEGRRYFQEKFGVCPPVAYNFDSFGHPGSLPQLLKQSGFEMYVHCRPDRNQLDLPGLAYRWQGIDGTEMITVRPYSWYCNVAPEGRPQIDAQEAVKMARESGQDMLITWGLGDHGGGATREDLDKFRKVIAEYAGSDVEIRHSTPEAYLARIKASAEKLPVQRGELQRVLAGCYTSIAPIKRAMREGEALLASAERWASIAWWRYGVPYPAEDLRLAWKRLMFNTFHDILCGSLLEEAMPAVNDIYGVAQDIARRVLVRSHHALLPDIPSVEGTIPVYVFNPHSTPLQAPVGLNFMADYRHYGSQKTFTLYDDQGASVASQGHGGHSVVLENSPWNPYLAFVANVPPLAVRRYELRPDSPATLVTGPINVKENDAGIDIETRYWAAHFSREHAALASLIERSSGRNLLKEAVQLFAMQDVAHAWGGMDKADFNIPVSPFAALSKSEVGDFTGMDGKSGPALRILAQGPVSVTIECLVGWQHTRASLRFTFYADLPYIDVDTRLYMQARRKMIKLVLPFDLPGNRAICEVPYGVAERPIDATEYPYTRWLRLEGPEIAVGIANNGQNGLDISADGKLGLSISRGAIHCHWDEPPQGLDVTKSYTYMDQTQIDTRFRLLANPDSKALAAQLIPAALDLNQPLERFFTYFPPTVTPGAPKAPLSFLQIEPATIILGTLKKAEQEEALILRLAETIGQPTNARVTLEGSPTKDIAFEPHEIKTFKLKKDGKKVSWHETNLIEE